MGAFGKDGSVEIFFFALFLLSNECGIWKGSLMHYWMKKIGPLLSVMGLGAIVVAGCATHQKESKNGVVVVEKAPKPTARMAKISGYDLDELGRGYSAFMVQCAQCHEYKLPNDLSRAAWHQANWNVGMEKEDEQALVKYLLAEIASR